jgi:hypothetical protein
MALLRATYGGHQDRISGTPGLLSPAPPGPMVRVMGAPRSRTPDEPGARHIAAALYPDVDSVEWIPSDDAGVYRLSFTSDREPLVERFPAGWVPAGLDQSRLEELRLW